MQKATVMNMKLWLLRVLESMVCHHFVVANSFRPRQAFAPGTGAKVLSRMTFRNGGHQGKREAVIDDGVIGIFFSRSLLLINSKAS